MPEARQFIKLEQQRDSAVACACLSFAISLAILVSNFRDHSAEIENVRKAVDAHRVLLAEAEQILQDNIDALHRTEAALGNVKKVEAGASQ